MSWSILLACLWGLIANVAAMIPSRDNLWTRAYILIATGIPIVGFVAWEHGAVAGIVVLVAGMWMLRWPVIYLGRWIKRKLGRG